MRLRDEVGDCPIVYESGKIIADKVFDWWVRLAGRALDIINGTEATA